MLQEASDLALAALLALIVNAAVTGVVGNRADAGLGVVCKCLISSLQRSESTDIQQVLKKALWLSYLRALISISSACKVELIGNFPQHYRGQPVYSEAVKSDIRWLDRHLAQLEHEVRAVEGRDVALSDLALQDLERLLVLDDGAIGERVTAQALAMPEGAIPLYVEKLHESGTGLLDRVFAFFTEELHQNPELKAFFETQLLMQIRSGLAEQSVTLQDMGSDIQSMSTVVQEIPQQFEQVLDRLNSLEAPPSSSQPDLIAGLIADVKALLLGMQRGSVEQTSAVSLVISDVNPFVPLSGRIDSPDQFFGREEVLAQIFEVLNSGSSVALIGKRATGKSSLLKAVEARAKESLTLYREPIYLDLRDVADEDDFYYALCDKAGIPECKGYRFKREMESKRLLLLLDEIEQMTWDGFTNQVRGQLRGLAEGQNAPLRLVIAASKSLDRLFPDSADSNLTSPLSGICLEEAITGWDEGTIRAFIADRLQTKSVQFAEADILAIVQASQGNPKQVVTLCYERYASFQRSLS